MHLTMSDIKRTISALDPLGYKFDDIYENENNTYLIKRFVIFEKALGYGATFHNYNHKDRTLFKIARIKYHLNNNVEDSKTDFENVADYYEDLEKALKFLDK